MCDRTLVDGMCEVCDVTQPPFQVYGAFTKAKLALPPLEARPYCLGFNHPTEDKMVWQAQPDIVFRPDGILFYGVTDETVITDCRIANRQHLLASAAPIPAKFFAAGDSFDSLVHLMKEKSELGKFFHRWLKENPKVEPRQLVQFSTLSPGTAFRLETRGPVAQIVLWGLACVN